MKIFRKLFNTLGGLPCALLLIALTAAFVIAGTILESKTESHLFAAHFTYGNPLFKVLLAGFFINILFAALRRWPFRLMHIPFLITHLGLLMILAGTIAKSFYGVQGNMTLLEGSGSQEIFIPGTYALYLEKRDPADPRKLIVSQAVLHKTWDGRFVTALSQGEDPRFPELRMDLKEYLPHSSQKYLTWIKGDKAYISGIRPFPVHGALESMGNQRSPLVALTADDPDAAARKLYEQGLDASERVGPRIALIQSPEGHVHFYVFNSSGEAMKQVYSSDKLETLVVYDEGFGGYAVQAKIPSVGSNEDIVLETPLIPFYKKEIPGCKLEDNVPLITVEISAHGQKEVIKLPYEKFAGGLKWPVLGGKYLLRFQPEQRSLPYRLRLRQARQINYPNTSQPYSYESDLLFKDVRTGALEDKTISMNNVFETWEGFRFYLANIVQPTEMSVKRIQIIVNHDPAKYWLTYPGAFILTIGIILLFWMRPYKK